MTIRTAIVALAYFLPSAAFAADLVVPVESLSEMEMEVLGWESEDSIAVNIDNSHRTLELVWDEDGRPFAVIGRVDDEIAVTITNDHRVAGEDGTISVSIDNSH